MSKDKATKKYFSDNNVFADLFNYYMFNGKQVIVPEELEERDSAELLKYVLENGEALEEQKYRDLLKRCVIKSYTHQIFILLGFEGQSEVHYAMPLKNNMYDVMNYAKQAEKIAKQHKKDRDLRGSEFLSGFSKEDKLTPVITLVVYLSPDEWDGPKSLHSMLSTERKEILQYVNDYKLNIIEPNKMQDSEKFITDLKYVMDFIKVSKDKEKMELLLEEEKEIFSRMPVDTAMMLNECANVELDIDEEAKEINMCKAWDDMREEVRRETEAKMCKAWEDEKEAVRKETEAKMCKAWEDEKEAVRKETEAKMCKAWEDEKEAVRKETEAKMCKAWEDEKEAVRKETERKAKERLIIKYYMQNKITLEEALEDIGLSKKEFLTKVGQD